MQKSVARPATATSEKTWLLLGLGIGAAAATALTALGAVTYSMRKQGRFIAYNSSLRRAHLYKYAQLRAINVAVALGWASERQQIATEVWDAREARVQVRLSLAEHIFLCRLAETDSGPVLRVKAIRTPDGNDVQFSDLAEPFRTAMFDGDDNTLPDIRVATRVLRDHPLT